MGGEVEHEKQMPQLTPRCRLRLSAIILMNRQEHSDTCLYDMWQIHIHDAAARLFLCNLSVGGCCWQPNIDIDKVINGRKQLSPPFHHCSTTNGNPVALLLSLQSVMRSSLPASSTGSAWLFSQCSSQRWVISPSSARSWCSSLSINATWCRMPASLAHRQILIRILTIPTMPRASTWIDSD